MEGGIFIMFSQGLRGFERMVKQPVVVAWQSSQ